MTGYYKFVGPDPIDHFTLGRIEPGDVVEVEKADEEPAGGPWEKATKKAAVEQEKAAEQDSDQSDSEKEG